MHCSCDNFQFPNLSSLDSLEFRDSFQPDKPQSHYIFLSLCSVQFLEHFFCPPVFLPWHDSTICMRQPALRPDSCRLDLDAMKFRAIISSSQQPGQPVQEIWRGAMGWKTWMIWEKSQTDEQMFQLRWLRTLNQKLDDEDWGTGKKGWKCNSHVHSLVNRDVARTTANGNPKLVL